MPVKSRRSRAKRKARSRQKPLAVKEVSKHPLPVSVVAKQVAAAKSAITIAQSDKGYQYVRSDLRRSAVTGGILFVILLVLYFCLR